MAKFLTVIAGVLVSSAIVSGTAVGLDRSPGSTPSATASPTTKVAIVHVKKGCHVWRKGKLRAVSVGLRVKRGGRLQIRNRDIEPHELVQLAGPNLALQGHIMPGNTQLITFKVKGVYRFKTKVVEMGPSMNVETIGPDNRLRLKVSVR